MGYSFFSPGLSARNAVLNRINNANDFVIGLLNSYESGEIHLAMLEAQDRTGLVYLIFDRRIPFLQGPRLDELLDHGAVPLVDTSCRRVFSQYLIIDEFWIVSGSYLYSHLYDDHYTSDLNLLDYSNEYTLHSNDWNYHYDHSQLYTGIWPPA